MRGILATWLPAAALLCLPGCSDDAPEVETAVVGTGCITESVPVEGRIRPVKEVEIAAEVSGEIVALPVAEGNLVHRGDILMTIRPDVYKAAVESAEASLGMLEAEYSQQVTLNARACSTLVRVRRLHSGSAAAYGEVESAVADSAIAAERLLAAAFAVKRGEAALREAEDNLARTSVVSPISGTVTYLAVKEGERIVGTSQMAGTVAMKIADLCNMELVAGASERDILKIGLGDSAKVVTESSPDIDFRGKVSRIANSAKNIDVSFGQVANFEVRIAILPEAGQNPDIVIRPGMSASASILTEKLDDVTLIPVCSMFAKGRREYVWLVDKDGRVHSTAIGTGIQDLDRIEVISGLKTGDRIVCGPVSAVTKDLEDGMKVRFRID